MGVGLVSLRSLDGSVERMSMRSWIETTTTAGPLTREMVDATFASMEKQGFVRRHSCKHDGHVELFMSTRCVCCGEVVRDLTVDENHIRLGEFW